MFAPQVHFPFISTCSGTQMLSSMDFCQFPSSSVSQLVSANGRLWQEMGGCEKIVQGIYSPGSLPEDHGLAVLCSSLMVPNREPLLQLQLSLSSSNHSLPYLFRTGSWKQLPAVITAKVFHDFLLIPHNLVQGLW